MAAAGAKFGVFPLERERRQVPGREITDHQMELYMTHRKKDRPALAGAKAGFSTATAYRIEADAGRPSEKRKGRGAEAPGIRWRGSSRRRSYRCWRRARGCGRWRCTRR